MMSAWAPTPPHNGLTPATEEGKKANSTGGTRQNIHLQIAFSSFWSWQPCSSGTYEYKCMCFTVPLLNYFGKVPELFQLCVYYSNNKL